MSQYHRQQWTGCLPLASSVSTWQRQFHRNQHRFRLSCGALNLGKKKDLYYYDDTHWSPVGAELIAEENDFPIDDVKSFSDYKIALDSSEIVSDSFKINFSISLLSPASLIALSLGIGRFS